MEHFMKDFADDPLRTPDTVCHFSHSACAYNFGYLGNMLMTDTIKRVDDCPIPERLEPAILDPAQCRFRETCPHVMQCVTEFLVELARKDWLQEQVENLEGGKDERTSPDIG